MAGVGGALTSIANEVVVLLVAGGAGSASPHCLRCPGRRRQAAGSAAGSWSSRQEPLRRRRARSRVAIFTPRARLPSSGRVRVSWSKP